MSHEKGRNMVSWVNGKKVGWVQTWGNRGDLPVIFCYYTNGKKNVFLFGCKISKHLLLYVTLNK